MERDNKMSSREEMIMSNEHLIIWDELVRHDMHDLLEVGIKKVISYSLSENDLDYLSDAPDTLESKEFLIELREEVIKLVQSRVEKVLDDSGVIKSDE